MWVALPLDGQRLATLVEEGLRDVTGHAATDALAAAQSYLPDSEESERAAAIYASISALVTFGCRRVAVVDANATELDTDDPFGRVLVSDVRWAQVQSLFVDAPEAARRARELADVLRGCSLEEAWDRDDVHRFLEDAELMWFDPTERHVLSEGC